MSEAPFIQGEFRRTLDERFRLSLPQELGESLEQEGDEWILTKERPGALSLWSAARWRHKLNAGVDLVRAKIQAGRMEGRMTEVQQLGRLLSTRHKEVRLTGRGRLLIPEGFREFLAVEPGGEVLVVGAAICIEIWRPDAWLNHLEQNMPEFGQLFDRLSS